MIITGAQFVYYRGIRRQDRAKDEMEHFGCGTIGDVWLDPDTQDNAKARQNWYCSIDSFSTPLPPDVGGPIAIVSEEPKVDLRRPEVSRTDVEYEAHGPTELIG